MVAQAALSPKTQFNSFNVFSGFYNLSSHNAAANSSAAGGTGLTHNPLNSALPSGVNSVHRGGGGDSMGLPASPLSFASSTHNLGGSSAQPVQEQLLGVQQLQAASAVGPVKLEAQSQEQQSLLLPKMEVKMEPDLHHISPQLQKRQELLQLQQRQQRLLHQQRVQQQQQQHMLHSLPHLQRTHLQQQQQLLQQQQQQQKLQQQQFLLGSGPSRTPHIELGMCARRLMQYMYHQRHRPADNNISFWRKFVGEYFGPRAKKRWCVSLYGSGGRPPTGVFPQDVWHCEICGTRPGRGFETTVEVLPRLSKIKYDSGILEELLFVDLPREYRLRSGHMVLEYGKAIQESVFEQLRVVRDGRLRIIFNPDLRIKSWEFCARSHEELLPRRLIVPQVTQLASIAQKYNTSAQNGGSGLNLQDMQTNCKLFVTSSRQLARNLEVPPVNDLGYTKRYVRCLQISEVVNSMKDLIDFSSENKIGPIESLLSFPRRNAASGAVQSQSLHQADQEAGLALVSEQVSSIINSLQLTNGGNHSGSTLASSVNGTSQNASSRGSLPSLVHQSSLNSLQNALQDSMSNSLSSSLQGAGNGYLSNSLQQASQGNSVSFQNSLPSLSGSLHPTAMNNALSGTFQQNSLGSASTLLQANSLQSSQISQQDTQSVVQHLLQEMMMNQQMNGGGSLQQGMGGNSMLGSVGASLGYSGGMNGVNTGATLSNGSGALGNSNQHLGNSNTLAANAGSLSNNSMGLANSLRNMGNLNAMNALSGGIHLASVAQSQNLQQYQDPTHGLQHELAGNGISSNLGASAGFSGLSYSWKSP